MIAILQLMLHAHIYLLAAYVIVAEQFGIYSVSSAMRQTELR